jgi:integrase
MQYRARYIDTSGQEHTKRFKYKADATDWLKEVTRKGADIAPAVKGKWTVAQQYKAWIRKADIAETTKATRTHTWNAHVADKWGDFQVTKVDPPGVKAWVADMKDAGVGAPTIENALGVLRMVLADALSDNRLVRNPCDGVKAPKRQPKPRAYLTHEQVETLASAVGDDALVIQLLAYTGLRLGGAGRAQGWVGGPQAETATGGRVGGRGWRSSCVESAEGSRTSVGAVPRLPD